MVSKWQGYAHLLPRLHGVEMFILDPGCKDVLRNDG